MCGIAGIYRRRGVAELGHERLRAMADTMVHRGPDDFGYLLLDSRDGRFQIGQDGFGRHPCDVCLGNRRLAIVDLSPNGRQPILNETGDISVVFNGEIFNHIELRHELAARGHVFRSHTDTEVIVHAYEEWGADCVTRFNGMWALALWDQRRREMFCSRDRFGIKPFYYRLDADTFLFASEIKALLPALDGRPSPDYGALGDYLVEGTLCRSTDTFFDGVKRLEPAHSMVVSSGAVRSIRYWDYLSRGETRDESKPVEAFRGLLDDAVRLRLRGDVPAGIALSGGLDSTSVLALAAPHATAGRIKAFTAVFPGASFDEQKHARLAARELGAELFCVEDESGGFIDDLRRIVWHMDYPALDGQVFSRWRLMRLASRHVKVILEGQGADEMLAGYIDKYFLSSALDALGGMGLGESLDTLGKLWEGFRHVFLRNGWPGWARKQWRSLPFGPRNLSEKARVRRRACTPEFLRLRPVRRKTPPDRPFPDRLTNALHYDHAIGILPRLLKFGDALSMAFSVESRVPFLDHRLVEFVFRLPPRDKLDGAVSKCILREAMAGVIPEQIRARRDKIGFRTPVGRWIRHNMDSGIRPLLLSDRCRKRGVLDVKEVERILALHANRRARAEQAIFRWVSTELWFRLFIDGEGAPTP